MAISARAVGAWAIGTADPTTYAIPAGGTTTDMMLMVATWKPFSITATADGWTELIEFADGTVAAGNGVGSMKVGVWYKEHDGTESNPQWNGSGTANIGAGHVVAFQKATNEMWATPVAVSAGLSWGTGGGVATATSTVALAAGDLVYGVTGIRDDTATIGRGTATGIAAVGGVTWNGNYVEYPSSHYSTTTNTDMSADAGYRLVTAGTAAASLTAAGTPAATETGAFVWVVLQARTATSTGALTGTSAAVVGAATTTHTSTGALAGSSVVIDGTADNQAPAGPVSATGTAIASAPLIVGAAKTTHTSTGALTGTAPTVVGAATRTSAATGAPTGSSVVIAGTGTRTSAATGALAATPVVVSGTGTRTSASTGAVTGSPPVIAGTASVPVNLTGTGAPAGAPPTVTGAAKTTHAATGALAGQPPAIVGTATSLQGANATGVVITTAPTMNGTGLVRITGTGAITAPSVVINGTGAYPVAATGALTTPSVVVNGTGQHGDYVPVAPVGGYYRRQPLPKPRQQVITGSGAITIAPAVIHGRAQHEYDDLWLFLDPASFLAGVT